MRIALLTLLLALSVLICFSQEAFTFPENDYRSPQNEYYWKNRSPEPGYWQQDVRYKIEARVDPVTATILGKESLTYFNNSPDTLHFAYFHLYQNAFQPDSYLDQLRKADKNTAKWGPVEKKGKGTDILGMKQGQTALSPEVDNTILRVKLATPLPPGQHTQFDIEFITYFDPGSDNRRMKAWYNEVLGADGATYKVLHLNGVLWYPRIAVYDKHLTWNTAQHLGHEFYGDFGSFEVSLTFPNNYVVDGTGILLNEKELISPQLREVLDIANFRTKPWGEAASEVIKPDGSFKTWHFQANNVHDFAFTADPTYRIGEAEYNGVRCIALAEEAHAQFWQDAASFAAKVIEVYSEDIGRYGWPKIIVADARDGMEYPMLTLDGGRSPGYHGLFAHEIGHQWFYGMIGSNETYRAFLDEGFTQFLTAWSMAKIKGKYSTNLKYSKKRRASQEYATAFYGYLNQTATGSDHTLNIHSNAYLTDEGMNRPYGQVYYKTATMLYNLQYVLGEKLFQEAMKHYFDKWKFAHPYPEDFRQAITEYAKTDLTWFFDQWMETEKQIDYQIKWVHKKKFGKKINVTLERKGEMQMPIDVAIVRKKDTLHYTIPNTDFIKSEGENQPLPKWSGQGRLNPTYTFELEYDQRVKKIILDPTERMADVYLPDNSSGWRFPHVRFSLLPREQPGIPDRTRAFANIRPGIWWNGYAGLQAGASIRGDFMRHKSKYSAGFWYSTGLGHIDSRNDKLFVYQKDYQRFNYTFRYETPIKKLGPGFDFQLNSSWRDGLHNHWLGFSKKWTKGSAGNPNYSRLYGRYKYLERSKTAWLDYLNMPDQWAAGEANTYCLIGYQKGYKVFGGKGDLSLELRSSSLGSDRQYANLTFESGYQLKFSKLEFKYRLFARYGDGNTPPESMLYLAGGSPEEMMDDDFYRARGFFPNAFFDNDQGRKTYAFHYGGGLNLRGYSGYYAEYEDKTPAWYANNGAALSLELDFDRFVPFSPKKLRNYLSVDSYLFFDAGVLGRSLIRTGLDEPDFSAFRMDAGAGFALNIKDPWFFKDKPLTIRADFPIWLSRPPAEENFFQFRYLIAIGRCF